MDSNSDMQYPYSPDVFERESSDDGFSEGWGMHFPACEKYWVDVHAHMELWPQEDQDRSLTEFIAQTERFNIKNTALILPMLKKAAGDSRLSMVSPFPDGSSIKRYISRFGTDSSFRFLLYLDHKNPDAGFVREAAAAGVCGIKLHNAPIITGGDPCEVWLSEEWRKVFREIESLGLPVLWHVTQRLTDSPYTGGGRNSYWRDGWEKGVTYTNEDLLQVFLKVVGAFPGISFISAHQLHLGWKRLSVLFGRYDNLFSDTSVGCTLRQYDEFNDCDRDFIRDIFTKYSKRLLLGTDIIIEEGFSSNEISETYSNHIRFIKKLQLPWEALQDVSHLNARRLLKL